MLRLALLVALAQVAGCATTQPEPLPGPPPIATGGPAAVRPDSLDDARARWEAAALGDYRFTLQRMCFCPAPDYTGPFEVTVRDGEIAGVRLDGASVEPERAVTVDDLFTLIEEAYARRAETVRLAFDPQTGAPTEVYVDYDSMMADEEIGYTVTGLEAL